MNIHRAARTEHRTAGRTSRRGWWMDAMTGLLATSPFWLDPRWLADETGALVPNWEAFAEHQKV